MRGALYIGSVGGIRMYVHWSFFLLLAYVVALKVVRGETFSSGVLLMVLILALFITVLMHELGHALVAKRFGCITKNIVLLPIGGMARMDKMPEDPRKEVFIALAGPAVNLAIALVAFVFLYVARGHVAAFTMTDLNAHNWWDHFMYSNLILALFNLLPAFPMDGGRIFRGALSFKMPHVRATMIAARTGQVVAVLMMVAGLMGSPLLVMIGLFIIVAAQVEAASTSAQAILHGSSVSEVMIHRFETVQATTTLRHAMRQLLDSQATKFIVIKDGKPVGHFSRQGLMEAVAQNGQDVFIESCMSRELIYVKSGDPLDVLFAKMQTAADTIALVASGNGIHGYIELDNIMEFVSYRQALERNSTHISHI